MIGKSESIYWANVWWILAADNLTFEEVMVDFRKKYPVHWFRGRKACKDMPGKNNILHWKKFPSWRIQCWQKKSYTVISQGKNSRGLEKKFSPKLNHPYPLPHKSQMGNHIGGGEEAGEFDTLADVIRKQNGWRAYIMWWFLRLKFYISRLKIRRWKTSGKRKFKRVLRFLFVDKRELFAIKLSFQEFNLICPLKSIRYCFLPFYSITIFRRDFRGQLSAVNSRVLHGNLRLC